MSKAVIAPAHETIGHEAGAVHAWRVSRLMRVGLAQPMPEAVADRLDWRWI
ncbi:MAG: hypothetical protein ACRDRJ_32870 [Streptosporangiaceae bacterium]